MSEEYVLYSIIYILFCICIVYPPTEFISAGLTLNQLFSTWLPDENLNFIEYHLHRSTLTMIAHSFLPLGFFFVLHGAQSESVFSSLTVSTNLFWQLALFASVMLSISVISVIYGLWRPNDWRSHPIVKVLHLYDANNWRSVASAINTEYRRFDKFTVTLGGIKRIIVTDSWIILTDNYSIKLAQQADARLELVGADEHALSHLSEVQVQFVNIKVENISKPIKPFTLRLNSLDYREMRNKLQAPVQSARDVVIHLSLDERFVEAFRKHAEENAPFVMSDADKESLDNCIGCMQKKANVKLEKSCVDLPQVQLDEEGRPIDHCRQCYCRPMWCLSCMGRWFASRQAARRPETWLSGKSPCPTCRATFCVLDVSLVP